MDANGQLVPERFKSIFHLLIAPSHLHGLTPSDLCNLCLVCKFCDLQIKPRFFRVLRVLDPSTKKTERLVSLLLDGNVTCHPKALHLGRSRAQVADSTEQRPEDTTSAPDPRWAQILCQLKSLKELVLNLKYDNFEGIIPPQPTFLLTQLTIVCTALKEHPHLASFLFSQSSLLTLTISTREPIRGFHLPESSLQRLRSLNITTGGHLGHINFFRGRGVIFYRELAISATRYALPGLGSLQGLVVSLVPTPSSSRYDLALPNLDVFEVAEMHGSHYGVLVNYLRRMPRLRVLLLVYVAGHRPSVVRLADLFTSLKGLALIHFVVATANIYEKMPVPDLNIIPYTLRRGQRQALKSTWDPTAWHHPLLSRRILDNGATTRVI